MEFLFVGPGFCLGFPSDSQSLAKPLLLANASHYQACSGFSPYSVCHACHTIKKVAVFSETLTYTLRKHTGSNHGPSTCKNVQKITSFKLWNKFLIMLNEFPFKLIHIIIKLLCLPHLKFCFQNYLNIF